jgi:hypothetical protein
MASSYSCQRTRRFSIKFRELSLTSGLLLAALAVTRPVFASEVATAVIGDVPTSGGYNYSITLNNTGTTPIGTFWFSWVPGAGFLTATPTNVTSPSLWTDTLTNAGAAIQWKSTDPSSLLEPGNSLSGFDFFSTETPSQLEALVTSNGNTDPGLVASVYEGAPLAGPVDIFNVVEATPEPPSILLALTGVLGMASFFVRKQMPSL